MQIMRFVVFFIQEYLYSNILANSIFYSLLKNSEYLILQVLGYSECLILHISVCLECLILQVLVCSECLILHILLKVSVLHGSTLFSFLFPISNTQSYTGCILMSLCLMHKNIT